MRKIDEWDIGFFAGTVGTALIVYLAWPWWAEILLAGLVATVLTRLCRAALRRFRGEIAYPEPYQRQCK